VKPPAVERIREEDIPDAPEWFRTRIVYLLNRFMETVVKIFTKNINFQDNFDSQLYQDKINATSLSTGYKFAVTTRGIPKGVLILKLVKTTELWTNFTVAPYPLWEYQESEEGRNIILHNILGIDATSDYNLTLLVV